VFQTFLVIPSLLVGMGLLLIGNASLGTLLAVRATAQEVPSSGVGAMMSLYFLGFGLGTIWVPALIRRIRYIRAFSTVGAVICSVALLHGLSPNLYLWGLLRFVSGFCMVGAYMVIESWLNVLASDEKRSAYFAAYMAVCLFALGCGQFLVSADDGVSPTVFMLSAVFISAALIPVSLTRVAEPVLGPLRAATFRHVYRKAPLGVIGCTVSGILGGAFWGMGPSFVRTVSSVHAVAWFMAAGVFGGLFFQWPTGWLSGRFDRRKVLSALSFAGALLGLLLFLFPIRSTSVLGIGAFALGAALFALYPVSVAIANDRLSPGETLESARGLLLLNGLGAAAGPIMAGGVMDVIGERGLFILFAVLFAGLAVYAAYRLRVPLPRPAEEQTPFAPLTRTSVVVLDLHPGVTTTDEMAAVQPREADPASRTL